MLLGIGFYLLNWLSNGLSFEYDGVSLDDCMRDFLLRKLWVPFWELQLSHHLNHLKSLRFQLREKKGCLDNIESYCLNSLEKKEKLKMLD